MARASEAPPGPGPWLVAVLVGLVLALGCEGEEPEEAGSRPPREEAERSEEVRRGRQLYERHGCALCHGPRGRGDGRLAASQEPPPRDLHDSRHYRQGYEVERIEASIREGVGRNMPAYGHLSRQDSRDLAIYIHSLLEPTE